MFFTKNERKAYGNCIAHSIEDDDNESFLKKKEDNEFFKNKTKKFENCFVIMLNK